jgi:hypothetical protein
MLTMRLAGPEDADAFCAFLRDVHVRVDAVDGATVRASTVAAPTAMHERNELLGYVATWNALNPGRHVTVEH